MSRAFPTSAKVTAEPQAASAQSGHPRCRAASSLRSKKLGAGLDCTFAGLPLLLVAVLLLVGAGNAQAGKSETSFATTILPILTKAGCNAGACHGAAIGQGGFKLSLLGYDPERDHEAITRELDGRRIDLGSPELSLVLRKPMRELDHDGGRRIKRDSDAHRTLLEWIAAGAPYGARDLTVTAIEVEPRDLLVEQPGESAPLTVRAFLNDGSVEDVTALALYNSNDDGLADVDREGVVTVRNRGLTAIMVRYSGQVAAVRAGAPFQERPLKPVEFSPHNFVDKLVLAELERLRIPPSPLCTESEFFRRVHLDMTGRLPEPDAVRRHLAGPPSLHRREKVIEGLLASPAFVDFWTLKLADVLRINSKRLGEQGAKAYHNWLRRQIAANAPLNEVARDLVVALGDPTEHGPANFHRLTNDPRDMGEFVSQTWLGARVACARCHNHPFDRWTMNDYYHFAAFFARTGIEGQEVVLRPFGEVLHPKTNQPLTPRPLGAGRWASPADSDDPRVSLAKWLTAPDNTLFARSLVNRVWKELAGRGLVEPEDDLRPTNPPSNPALLDALAGDFARGGFDLRQLVRTIVSSRTYQLSSQANQINQLDDRFFSRAYLKPLTAQVLADSIAQATGVPDEFEGYDAGTRAVELIDAQVSSYTLDVFGRCPRTASCESSAQFGGGLAQALHLVNGTAINAKLGRTAEHLLARKLSHQELLEELYLRTLSRLPRPEEASHWMPLLEQGPPKAELLEDLLWALLNSREFAFNN